MGEITIDKMTYNQSIEVLDESKGKIKYESVAVNEKGESEKTAYEFYVTDIDKNTLIRKPSGKKFFVSLSLNNKQKFIKYYKNDKFESYSDNVEILVIGADVAQNVIDLFKSAMPLIKNKEQTWATAAEALNWLKSNIGEVKDKTGTIEQSFTFNDSKTNLLELTIRNTDTKGVTTEEKYNWNLTDINKNKLLVKVTGTLLNVVLEIKNNDKYIRYMKGSDLQNYTSTLEIASDDIDKARNLIAAFSTSVDKSKPQTLEFKTPREALEYIRANVGEAVSDQKSRKQKVEFTGDTQTQFSFSTEETDSKGKTLSSAYEFYLEDAEPNVIFKVSGKKILIPVLITGKNKFIKYTKDNILQNYVEDIEIYLNDLEMARDVANAFKNCYKGQISTMRKFGTAAEAMKFLGGTIEGATIVSDIYKITFDGSETDPFPCNYSTSKTDAKGITTDESFLFYPYQLDANSIKVSTEGKYLNVSALISGKKSFIRKVKKDQTSFINELNIMVFDVKKAKETASALKYLAANTTPKAKTFSDKKAALDFVKQNTSDITNGTKSIKQKIETAEDSPCKLTLTVSTTDDKGKTTEQVFEFSLSDINKQGIDFKPSDANMSVLLSSKNKQKLIRVYKDGVQQSFGSDVMILFPDVEMAKNITEALKLATTQCE
ncbi:MAG: hypothetical protein HC905_10060 [Bacteroidales bacterium]|nr:hypothetical protein [Bacteroidales bacterium]